MEDARVSFLKRTVKGVFESMGVAIRVSTKKEHEPTVKVLDKTRGQVKSSPILSWLNGLEERSDFDILMGLIEEDLYSDSHPSLNFIFGEAEVGGKCCIVSTCRLQVTAREKKDARELLYLERIGKEIVHETCHVLGMRHCNDRCCIMYFSNSIINTDDKDIHPCDTCARQILKLIEKRKEKSIN
ncbi:hypothetical protein GF325_16855 [Candidatus Bathyarchaeota archaeon]|nr:hypothetical protein [Candidatus Bathyarchaeota archaeon]